MHPYPTTDLMRACQDDNVMYQYHKDVENALKDFEIHDTHFLRKCVVSLDCYVPSSELYGAYYRWKRGEASRTRYYSGDGTECMTTTQFGMCLRDMYPFVRHGRATVASKRVYVYRRVWHPELGYKRASITGRPKAETYDD